MVPSSASTRPVIPVSSATSRSAVCGERLAGLDVALGQAPLDAAGAVAAGDHRGARAPLVDVDDDSTGGALLDRGQPATARSAAVPPLGCSRSVALTGPLRNQRRNAPGLPCVYAGAPCHRASCPTSCVPRWPGWLRSSRSAQELGERFAAAGHELALVGGPVRDAFLGRTSPDLDFTTDATPDETLEVIRGWADAHWEIGRAFGTIGLRRGAHLIEVTTYRSDVYDRTSRKPAVTFGSTLERRPGPAGLHGQRDGGPVPVAGVRRRARRSGRPRGPRAADPVAARGVVRGRPAADASRRPVRVAARLHGGAGRAGGDDRVGRVAVDGLGGTGPRGAHQAAHVGLRRAPG